LDLPEISDALLHSYGFKSHLTKNHAKMNYKNGNRPLHTLNKSNGHVKLCYKKKKYNEISDFINANNFSIFNFRGRSKIDTSIIKLQQMFRKTFKKKKEAADKIKRLFRSILNKKYRKIIFQFDITEDTITCNKLERYCYYIIPDFEKGNKSLYNTTTIKLLFGRSPFTRDTFGIRNLMRVDLYEFKLKELSRDDRYKDC
jgi:hypothetical protein